ncbi:MAG: hypothetical protein EWV78_06125 [Microcystis aeruginosa Ma_MB_F_20061100_S20D]|uniref:Uncharacterized protein n=1 Tax=Microcystis aeruginosa Ma_MB_F_20061100_S20D TaxID=2486253 RepID=A0A552EU15_MICAE|nr:MAG: hypothetical protein EWV78_06125 [Microcystis aeruginosa Ma_MB_F_20061100_S20D]
MKILTKLPAIVLIFIFNLPNFVTAEEQAEHYIEYADIILNIQQSPANNAMEGYLLAIPCDNCPPTRIEVNQSTTIQINGNPVPLEKLGMKIDWQGAVFYLQSKPPVATRLMLN